MIFQSYVSLPGGMTHDISPMVDLQNGINPWLIFRCHWWNHDIMTRHSGGVSRVHLKQQVVVSLVGLCHDDLTPLQKRFSESLFGRRKFPSTSAIVRYSCTSPSRKEGFFLIEPNPSRTGPRFLLVLYPPCSAIKSCSVFDISTINPSHSSNVYHISISCIQPSYIPLHPIKSHYIPLYPIRPH